MTQIARPLYFRVLRLRHLKPRTVTSCLLFEGSIALGALLALADITNWWGVIAVPVIVATMVKLNDLVAGALVRPLAFAQLRIPGVRPSRRVAELDGTHTAEDPYGRPDSGVARGVAAVPGQANRRPPPEVPPPRSD